MAKTWKIKARMATGKATEKVENGIRIYNPGKIEWVVIREFTDPEEAEKWMAGYIRKKGLCCEDFKMTR
ncbi:MAG: hypothetical protein K2G63_03665 [Oscillospiraceae bacterium]|nr:hypothetical protein [Oscillospiraceae bacterium]